MQVVNLTPDTHIYNTFLFFRPHHVRDSNLYGSVEILGGTVDIYGSNDDGANISVIADDMSLAPNGSGVSGLIPITTKMKWIAFVTASGTPTIKSLGVVQSGSGVEL